VADILFLLILLQLKHWYVDFVIQGMDEVHSKAIYGDKLGIWHSAKHGIGTTMALWLIGGIDAFFAAITVGIVDAVIHYHIDWAKMNYGNRDIQNPLFWNHLGLDQMMHQLTYILIVWWLI